MQESSIWPAVGRARALRRRGAAGCHRDHQGAGELREESRDGPMRPAWPSTTCQDRVIPHNTLPFSRWPLTTVRIRTGWTTVPPRRSSSDTRNRDRGRLQGDTTLEVTGNSFAAAHVSGLVARILSKRPGLTPFRMKTVLHALADNVESDTG
ncbi:S8 family serine peptidase [Geodermatophilus sp. CPCC 205506]|uniref:S8 family serine peptidase n=1 Tax=Geodermatophilus sp. CPCC 205506 TaxID=2936596 RepID=UPI003F5311C1